MEEYITIRSSDFENFNESSQYLIDHPIVATYLVPLISTYGGLTLAAAAVFYLDFNGRGVTLEGALDFFTSSIYLVIVLLIASIWAIFLRKKRKELIKKCKGFPEIPETENVPIRVIKC